MGTGIGKGADFTIGHAYQNNRLTTHEQGHKVIHVRNLALVSHINPVALPDLLHFELKQLRIGKNGSINANNTLLVQVNHGIVPISVNAAAADDAGVQSVEYLLYTYDAGDQFNLTEGTTATTLAGFELQLTAHLNAATVGAFATGDLAAVTYQALAANTSIFSLGT